MRLTPDELFFGVHPKIIKDCANHLSDCDSFSFIEFCEALGAPEDEAKPIFSVFIEQGFVIKEENSENRYRGSSQLNRLALASVQ